MSADDFKYKPSRFIANCPAHVQIQVITENSLEIQCRQ